MLLVLFIYFLACFYLFTYLYTCLFSFLDYLLLFLLFVYIFSFIPNVFFIFLISVSFYLNFFISFLSLHTAFFRAIGHFVCIWCIFINNVPRFHDSFLIITYTNSVYHRLRHAVTKQSDPIHFHWAVDFCSDRRRSQPLEKVENCLTLCKWRAICRNDN